MKDNFISMLVFVAFAIGYILGDTFGSLYAKVNSFESCVEYNNNISLEEAKRLCMEMLTYKVK
jgi:hypothetical protein